MTIFRMIVAMAMSMTFEIVMTTVMLFRKVETIVINGHGSLNVMLMAMPIVCTHIQHIPQTGYQPAMVASPGRGQLKTKIFPVHA